jgi:hypothetical protein
MKDVTQDIVYSVVGCMLGNQMTTVTGWQIEPIIYPTVSPNSRGLFRVHGTANAARMLDAYVQGLRDAGWQADRHVVCAVAQATAALRCGFSTAGWPAAIVRDSEKRDQYVRDTEQRWGRSIEDIFAQWAAVTSFLLAQIDEARMILLA